MLNMSVIYLYSVALERLDISIIIHLNTVILSSKVRNMCLYILG